MSITTDELYRLLPALYRARDRERGGELRALVEVLAAQAALVERDIDRLYDDWFIETCDEWVVPYLGDLLAARALYPVSDATYSQRSRVANTIGYRRRKGTASMLADLARDTTGWAAHVVELFSLLSTTQHLVHVRPDHHRTPDLRRASVLELEGTAFDSIAHTADVRSADSGARRYNVMNVGIFLWRLRAFPIREAAAFAHGDGRFSVSPLGQPMPLFHAPKSPPPLRVTEADVPGPIRAAALHDRPELYYGPEKSIAIRRAGAIEANVVVCDLSDWSHRPPAGKVALDPALGRFAFPQGVEIEEAAVSYHYGFSGELGGGGYARESQARAEYVVARSGEELSALGLALERWRDDGRPRATIEIADSGTYDEIVSIAVPAGGSLAIRAASSCRPVIRLTEPLRVIGESGATFALEGLLLTGAPIAIAPGALGELVIDHTTLVPGLALDPRGAPSSSAASVVAGENPDLVVRVSRSITGPLDLFASAVLENSIVDAALHSTGAIAIRARDLTAEACTVFGAAEAEQVEISNSIFTGLVVARRKQEGCVRFSFLARGSSVPRRHRCQPDSSDREIAPAFTDTRYGRPGYAQLRPDTPPEIAKGAEDQSEMGAFHHLMQPQRETNLRSSLDEYLRVGLEAGIHYVT